MRKMMVVALMMMAVGAQAGFGIQVGGLSPNSGLDDNDNALMFGVDYTAKFAVVGLKLEALYVDSSGQYVNYLDDNFEDFFRETTIDIEGVLAADLMFYPMGTTFFIQAGVNYMLLDASDIRDLDEDVIDNQLGLNLGLGITILDKLMIQGKLMYTPDAINSSAVEAVEDLDENLFGYMVTAGWRF